MDRQTDQYSKFQSCVSDTKNIIYDAMSNLGPLKENYEGYEGLRKTMKAKYFLGHSDFMSFKIQ